MVQLGGNGGGNMGGGCGGVEDVNLSSWLACFSSFIHT